MATSAYPTLPSPPGGGNRIYLYKKSAVEEGHPVKFCCFEVRPTLTRTTESENAGIYYYRSLIYYYLELTT